MGILSEREHIAFVSSVKPETSLAYQSAIMDALVCRRAIIDDALTQLAAQNGPLVRAAEQLVRALREGHKVLAAGNGGSAAQAQHFVAEFVGRFKRERAPYAALSLTTDTSILTAVANDYGYEDVFARQVGAFGQPGDVLIVFSTSGESENLVRAVATGRERLMPAIAVTGKTYSRLARVADITVRVPVDDTAIAQELHMMLAHILCDIAESELAARESERGE